jgi:hypothetical protein
VSVPTCILCLACAHESSEIDEDTIMSLKMNNQESHAIPDAHQVHCPRNRHTANYSNVRQGRWWLVARGASVTPGRRHGTAEARAPPLLHRRLLFRASRRGPPSPSPRRNPQKGLPFRASARSRRPPLHLPEKAYPLCLCVCLAIDRSP